MRVPLLLLLLAAVAAIGIPADADEPSYVLTRDAWNAGTFEGSLYDPKADALTLAPAPLRKLWETELPAVHLLDSAVGPDGRLFATGTSRERHPPTAWLASLSSTGALAWESTTLGATRTTDCQPVTLTHSTDNELLVAGWCGNQAYLAAFSPGGRLLWRAPDTATTSLGRAIATYGSTLFTAGSQSEDGTTHGIVTAYDSTGEGLWDYAIRESTSAQHLAVHEGSLIALWRSPDGSGLTALTPRGEHLWTERTPDDLDPVRLAVGPEGLFLIARRPAGPDHPEAIVIIDATDVRANGYTQVTAYEGERLAPRTAAFDPQGRLLVGGREGDQALLLLWSPSWDLVGQEHLPRGSESWVQSVRAVEAGRFAVSVVSRSEGTTSSHVGLWAVPTGERSGTYVSTAFPIPAGGIEAITVTLATPLQGEVRLTLTVRSDPDEDARTWTWDLTEPHTRLEVDDVPVEGSARFAFDLRGAPGAYPHVRRLELLPGEPPTDEPEEPETPAEPDEPVDPDPAPDPEPIEEPKQPEPEPEPTPDPQPDEPVDPDPIPDPEPVEDEPPSPPRIVASTSVGLADSTVFTFHLEHPEAGSWSWTLGDGSEAPPGTVHHTYTSPGAYTVRARSADGTTLDAYSVHVFEASVHELALPFQLRESRLVAGDFDGDGWTDLVLWTPGRTSFFFLSGSGDGQFRMRMNRAFPETPSHLWVADIDGSGRDDLVLFPEGRSGRLWVLHGSRERMLEEGQPITLPLEGPRPVASFPEESGPPLLVLGQSPDGRARLASAHIVDGRLRTRFTDLTGDSPWMLPQAHTSAWPSLLIKHEQTIAAVWGRPGEAHPPEGAPLAVGDLTGDGQPDWLVVHDGHVHVASTDDPTTKKRLASWSPSDRWLMGDIARTGADQALQVHAHGNVTVHFLTPARGTLSFDLPFPVREALTFQLGGEAGGVLFVSSGEGEAQLLDLSP